MSRLVKRRRIQPTPNQMYWGALIDATMYGRTMPAPSNMLNITDFETVAGKRMSVCHFGASFKDGNGNDVAFPSTYFNNLRARGIIPWYSWHPASSAAADYANQPSYALARIIAGDFDSYITTWANAAKAWGWPFFLRFMHEMNGSWYPWGITNANVTNTRAQSVAAWQHVHDIFTSVGATNATWVWCPNNSASVNLSGLYPGDPYVDWTAADCYYDLHGTTKSAVYQTTYDEIYTYAAANKPMLIGETGCFDGASGAAHITEMLSAFGPGTTMPNVRCVLYFDQTDGSKTWPLDSPPSPDTTKRDAFRTAIAQPRYLTSDVSGYLSLPQLTKIPAPA